MNPHFHPYSDLSSPHPPSPDNSNYTTITGSGPGNAVVHHQNGHNHGHGQQQQQQQQQQQIPIDSANQPSFHQLNNNSSPPIKHCAGCGGKIVERFFLHALDRYWHNSCLKCYCCGALLADMGSSCYTRSGMILCKSDYSRMFVTGSCSACGQTIAANEFVMRTTSPTSNNSQSQQPQQQQPGGGGQQQQQQQQQISVDNPKHFPNQVEHHVFHLKCFTCSKCASQLRPGDRYYMLAGSLVCEQDWHKLLKNSTPNPPLRKGKVGRPRRSRD